jgi:hypothetical protein
LGAFFIAGVMAQSAGSWRLVRACASASASLRGFRPRECCNIGFLAITKRDNSMPTEAKQTTDTVLMIRPHGFQPNSETAASNAFQANATMRPAEAHSAALREFDELVDALGIAGINVLVFDDTPEPRKPDAIFPNNWISTHADGTVVLYPMQAENRRPEVRRDIVEALREQYGYAIDRLIDLSEHAERGQALEGTGSLVLDRVNRVAYACLSPRTDRELLRTWANELNYDVLAFDATDANSRPIYHTNVMMSVGERFAAVCLESIEDARQRARLEERLARTGHEIIPISRDQIRAFAGNMLQLNSAKGQSVLIMSDQARDTLDEAQIQRLEMYAHIIDSPVGTIEECSGGGIRCMVAEVFLRKNVSLQ